MPGGPYEVEIVVVNDPREPTRKAWIVRRSDDSAIVSRVVIDLSGARSEYEQPETEFPDWERAVACVNRWMHGQEWSW